MLLVLHALANDRQIGLEIQLEHAQRLFHIGRRRGDCDERQHHVALLDVVLDPLPVDGNVPLEEVESRMIQPFLHPVGVHVHAEHMPVGGVDDATGQVMADKAVHPKNQDFLHRIFSVSNTVIVSTRAL